MKNTDLRTKASEKDYFKLMNNSCFGKTMENPHKRILGECLTVQESKFSFFPVLYLVRYGLAALVKHQVRSLCSACNKISCTCILIGQQWSCHPMCGLGTGEFCSPKFSSSVAEGCIVS